MPRDKLGSNSLPRLSELKDRKLYVPRRFDVPLAFRDAIGPDASLKTARRGCDGLLCLVASIDSGKISATLAGSVGRSDPVFEAGDRIGRLLRNVSPCDLSRLNSNVVVLAKSKRHTWARFGFGLGWIFCPFLRDGLSKFNRKVLWRMSGATRTRAPTARVPTDVAPGY